MGGRISRREAVPQSEGARTNPYSYPPADGGNYFSSHYNFGHRKYETGDPEYFLFGDLSDVNFLNNKPIQFPYKQPGKQDPLSSLQCLINVHRDSVRLVKSPNNENKYFVAFEFNSDVDCRISLLSSLPDSTELAALRHSAGSGVTSSQHYLFPRGSERKFTGTDFPLTPGEMSEEDLSYDPENGKDSFPVAILIETADSSQYQNQLTICILDKSSDGGYTIKVLKQKLWVDGVEYLLQEVYGLENKARSKGSGNGSAAEGEEGEEGEEEEEGGDSEDEEEDLGAECVVCITDVRDTLLLPCRHLCLCASCANNLRYQSNNCPICRTPFRALLQVTALKPLDPSLELDEDEVTGNPRYANNGFETMTLLEALNGYKLKLPSENEAEEEEEEEAPAAEEGNGREGVGTEAQEERLENGGPASPASIRTTDTVISVEADPEVEALSGKPVRHVEHTHIDLELGHDIPGLVTHSQPEVVFRPQLHSSGGSEAAVGATVVTVVVEDGRSVEERGLGGEVEVGESASNASTGSSFSDNSTKSTDVLIKHGTA